MEEPRKKAKDAPEPPAWDLKKYSSIAALTAAVVCFCILFFFFLYRYHGFTIYWQKLVGVLQPVIFGFIVAYLVNPVMMFLEKHLFHFLKTRMKSEKKAKRTARSLGTVGSLLFLLAIIFILLNMMIPELVKSIRNVMVTLPAELNAFTAESKDFLAKNPELMEYMGLDLEEIVGYLDQLFREQILPQINTYLAPITSGVISTVRVLFNFVIGLVIAIYFLLSKETFIGQSKKIVYAVLPSKYGNHVLHMLRISNEMFGGFIRGKILDSAIIGVICYFGLLILSMPYSLLVAVIVGVTNVIPFFGPYVGAVPSFILIALADPMKGLHFLIFILVLQQVDGNIIGPKLLGDSTGLSAFWVVFAILVGGGLFGFMGMLLGVPTFAVIYYLIREVVAYILRRRNLPQQTKEYIRMQSVDVQTGEIRYKEKDQRNKQQQ